LWRGLSIALIRDGKSEPLASAKTRSSNTASTFAPKCRRLSCLWLWAHDSRQKLRRLAARPERQSRGDIRRLRPRKCGALASHPIICRRTLEIAAKSRRSRRRLMPKPPRWNPVRAVAECAHPEWHCRTQPERKRGRKLSRIVNRRAPRNCSLVPAHLCRNRRAWAKTANRLPAIPLSFSIKAERS